MSKAIKIIRCTICGSTEIDTDSKTYFKCKTCPFEWSVIDNDGDIKEIQKVDESDVKELPETKKQNKTTKEVSKN